MDRVEPETTTEFIKYGEGNTSIIITAPHGGKLKFPGAKIRAGPDVCNISDSQTVILSDKIIQYTIKLSEGKIRPYFVQALCHRKYCDLNRSAERAYQEEIVAPYYNSYHGQIQTYLKTMQEEYPQRELILLDIHGQSQSVGLLVRGTQNGKTIQPLLKKYSQDCIDGSFSIFGHLQKHGIPVHPPLKSKVGSSPLENPAMNGGFTVSHYSGASTKNPLPEGCPAASAIQFEIGRDFRRVGPHMEQLDHFALRFAEGLILFHNNYVLAKYEREN